ncbi:MAG: N-acetylmuramoyl-L-alanine amidase, partial [Spirochaetaceae bacterium]|nr:N-acetylmuramoyl-L-alanine amidase [Spirochaetaceae bacterium]
KLIKDKLNGFLMSGNETFPEGNPPGGDRPATGNEIPEQPNPPQPPIRIAISSGHSHRLWGSENRATGMFEYLENVKVVDRVHELLEEQGVIAHKFHDEVSSSRAANDTRITNWHNSIERSLDVSIHFNSFDVTNNSIAEPSVNERTQNVIRAPVGPEVLYRTGDTETSRIAQAITNALYATMYNDPTIIARRVIVPRNDLPFLNDCNENPILIEVCFVNSRTDVIIYHRKFEEICQAIATSLIEAAISLRVN